MYWDSRKGNYEKYTNSTKHSKIAILAFSHGAVIKNFSEIINHNIKPDNSCGYCGISAMSITNNRMQIEMLFEMSHVT